MKIILALCLSVLLLSLLQATDEAFSLSKTIESKGSITISDGSSFYTFYKDGSFQSGPRGISGRVITGRWKISNDRQARYLL